MTSLTNYSAAVYFCLKTSSTVLITQFLIFTIPSRPHLYPEYRDIEVDAFNLRQCTEATCGAPEAPVGLSLV